MEMDNRLYPAVDSTNDDAESKATVRVGLTLHNQDGQVTEVLAMVRALNNMTKAGMPESVRIA